jgi:CheY-like chemotaxis protein/glycine cleavage system H lipoate-binding protein
LVDEWRVLVVDDEEVVLASVERLLGRDHMTVEKVPSGAAALERLRSRRFDVVITDLMMPRMDGLELLRRIRADGHNTPTILITGYATVGNAMKALKAGAVEYLPKPFTRSELRGAIHRSIRRRSLPLGGPSRESSDSNGPSAGSVYRLPEHTWLRFEQDGSVTVGMDPMFAKIVGELLSIDMPSINEFVEQGRACFMVVDREGISHFLCSPASGKVIRVSITVASHPNMVHEDPEGEGWLLKMDPMDLTRELRNLVPD